MKNTGLILAAAIFSLTACKGNKADQPLQNDLSLAQQQNQARLDSISAAERTRGEERRTRSEAPRKYYNNTGEASASSVAPAGHTVLQRNTQRDAVIGGAAGAAIGALSSKNKLQGGIIGAAAGGLLGGVIGNNVDVKKKKVP